MTKEEIRKVLELALEYYKLEIYGTGKESEPPTEARINWIYERMKPSLPSNLDDAAEISDLEAKNLADDYTKFLAAGLTNNEPRPIGPQWMKKLALDRFKAGAEWMVGQGWKEVSATDYPKPDRDKIYCVYTQKDYPHYLLAKVINHPDDDELLQWKCTQYPFTRYDMCEGDSYLEIRKKQ